MQAIHIWEYVEALYWKRNNTLINSKKLHIAISGTYSTGKTTTAETLSIVTGISKTQARTMREIVPEVFPGKMLEECSRKELSRLGLIRFRERILNEKNISAPIYISDGSCLHEWVYGQGRLKFGISPKQSYWQSRLRAIIGFRLLAKARDFLEIYGSVAKYHAKNEYDVFIHLPVEFDIKNDGHRPVSNHFREHTDRLLIDTLNEIGLKYHTVSGSIPDRIEKILQILDLKPIMPIQKAVDLATEKVQNETIVIEELRRRQRQEFLDKMPWWKKHFVHFSNE